MSLTVKTEWDTAALRAMAERLSARNFSRAMSVAVNASAKTLRGKARSRVAKRMGIPGKAVDKSFKVEPFAEPSSLLADVVGTGRAIPLINFAAKMKGEGTTAKAWGEGKLYPSTFVATMKSGHTGVFKRVGDRRSEEGNELGIKELWGPGVAQEMSREEVLGAIAGEGSDLLQRNVQRQLQRYLFKQGGG